MTAGEITVVHLGLSRLSESFLSLRSGCAPSPPPPLSPLLPLLPAFIPIKVSPLLTYHSKTPGLPAWVNCGEFCAVCCWSYSIQWRTSTSVATVLCMCFCYSKLSRHIAGHLRTPGASRHTWLGPSALWQWLKQLLYSRGRKLAVIAVLPFPFRISTFASVCHQNRWVWRQEAVLGMKPLSSHFTKIIDCYFKARTHFCTV